MRAPTPTPHRGGQPVKLLEFDLPGASGTRGALNIHKIREVVLAEGVTELPGCQAAPFSGLYDLRGTSIPVVDLATLLRVPPTVVTARARMLVCDLEGALVAIVVPAVHRLRTVHASDLRPPAGLVESGISGLVTAVVTNGSGLSVLLDVEALLRGAGVELRPDEEAPSETSLLAGRRALVVEDSATLRRQLRHLLEGWGLEVEEAFDGLRALEVLDAANWRFDVALLDIEMPRMGGVELARTMRGDPRGSGVVVVFHSSLSNPGMIRDLAAEGFLHYVRKFNRAEIFGSLSRALETPASGAGRAAS